MTKAAVSAALMRLFTNDYYLFFSVERKFPIVQFIQCPRSEWEEIRSTESIFVSDIKLFVISMNVSPIKCLKMVDEKAVDKTR